MRSHVEATAIKRRYLVLNLFQRISVDTSGFAVNKSPYYFYYTYSTRWFDFAAQHMHQRAVHINRRGCNVRRQFLSAGPSIPPRVRSLQSRPILPRIRTYVRRSAVLKTQKSCIMIHMWIWTCRNLSGFWRTHIVTVWAYELFKYERTLCAPNTVALLWTAQRRPDMTEDAGGAPTWPEGS